MKHMYKLATKELTPFQKAIIIATLIFIATCSAALFIAIGAQILGI